MSLPDGVELEEEEEEEYSELDSFSSGTEVVVVTPDVLV